MEEEAVEDTALDGKPAVLASEEDKALHTAPVDTVEAAEDTVSEAVVDPEDMVEAAEPSVLAVVALLT